jgi:hypothetical protein
MKILREYAMTQANYALVELDDGRRVELKLRKDEAKQEPSVEDWEALAKSLPEDSEISEPSAPTAPTTHTPNIRVYQDGEKIYG